MEMRIIAPGIDCKVTNCGIANDVVCELMSRIFYNEDHHKDVISLHFGNEERHIEISAKEDVALMINSKEYCLPDAVSIVTELICKEFFDK